MDKIYWFQAVWRCDVCEKAFVRRTPLRVIKSWLRAVSPLHAHQCHRVNNATLFMDITVFAFCLSRAGAHLSGVGGTSQHNYRITCYRWQEQ
jgi:hypothetical protein